MLLIAAASASPTPVQACEVNPLEQVCSAVQRATGGDTSVLGPLVQHVLAGLIIFLIVLVAGRICRGLVRSALDHAGGDPQVHTLARNVLTVATWTLALVGGLVAGGLDAAYVFTFGGIFSLAIGLAFQDLLRSVLAGIFILMEKPFRIGDQISVAEQSGRVREIALRTTSLLTADGRVAVIPNMLVFQSAVVVGEEPSSEAPALGADHAA
jgi:small conductance mechanosensitive channel